MTDALATSPASKTIGTILVPKV